MIKTKTLLIVAVAGVALLLIVGGVYAFFSDTETAQSNVFTVGTLNLRVGSTDPTVEHITMTGMLPNQQGTAGSWEIVTSGNVNGDLKIDIGSVVNNENGQNEVEVEAEDLTDGLTEGELGDNLQMAFWMDIDNDGWGPGDYYLDSNSGLVVNYDTEGSLPLAAYADLNSYQGKSYNAQSDVPASEVGSFKVLYNLPVGTTSIVQSDSSMFDITFELDQHM